MKKHRIKIIKVVVFVFLLYLAYWITNVALALTANFPGIGLYDFLSDSKVEKGIRWKLIKQLSLSEKILTFSAKIESTNLNENYYKDIDNTVLSEIDQSAVGASGTCSINGEYGSWRAGVWTATITGEKKYFVFTCIDGFKQLPDTDYVLTVD